MAKARQPKHAADCMIDYGGHYGGCCSCGALERAASKKKARSNRGANGSHGQHWIRDEKRHRIYERDGWRCIWCMGRVTTAAHLIEAGGAKRATLDHVIARSLGGTNDACNLVTSCVRCNSVRKDLDLLASVIALCQAEPSIKSAALRKLARVAKAIARPLANTSTPMPPSKDQQGDAFFVGAEPIKFCGPTGYDSDEH